MQYMKVSRISVKVSDLPVNDFGKGDIRSPPFEGNEAFKSLCLEVKKVGVKLPVFINSKNQVVSGHYRFWAAREIGESVVPVVVVESLKECLQWFSQEQGAKK